MIKINLFKKEGVYTNLLIGTEGQEKLNMPLYNTDFTVWKGVDNTIEFSIRNHDRKSVDMSDGILTFTMINQKTRQSYIKELETIDSALGRYKVVIKRKELNDYDCGSFVGHVSVLKDGTEELLYSGTDWYPFFNINIEPNKLEIVSESKVVKMDEMLREICDDKENGTLETFTSSAIKSNITPYHTFIMKLKDFCGEIVIQGSLMDTPQSPDDWFDITLFEHRPPHRPDDGPNHRPDDRPNHRPDDEPHIPPHRPDDRPDKKFKPINDTILLSSILNSLWVRVVFKRLLDSNSVIEEFEYRN